MKDQRPLTPEENKTAHILCIISIACEVLPMVLGGILRAPLASLMAASAAGTTSYTTVASSILSGLGGILYIAGIVLLIVVRVKYPANLFGKILMWVYIVLFIMFLLMVAVVIIACGMACEGLLPECGNTLNSCGSVGFIGGIF